MNWTTKMKIDVVTMDKEEIAKGRGIYDESKRKMGPKVSRMPTSKLAETKRLTSPIQEGTRTNEPHFSSKERRTATESSTITRVIVNQVNIDEKEQVTIMPWMLKVSNYPERSSQRKTKT